MRPLVEPPPAKHCDRCGGELRLKYVDLADRQFQRHSEVFVCASCGRERAFAVRADPYVAAAAYRARLDR